jgi:hypothetical protein
VICTVFETINTTGKRLTVFDLLVARCFPHEIKLRDMLEDTLSSKTMIKKFDPDGEEICVTAIPRIISLIVKGSCKRSDMLELKPEFIRDNWEYAVDALEKALTLLADQFGCFGARFIPLIDMVPAMAVFVGSSKYKDNSSNGEKLIEWYWRSVFSQYFVSATETKIARSVKEWLGEENKPGWLDDDSKEPESVRDFSFRESILEGVSRVDSAIYRGVMTMLLADEIADFSDKKMILKNAAWSEIEDHHIYPVRFLGPYGLKGESANTIANRTPILKSTNLKINNDAPHQYIKDSQIVGAKGVSAELLDKHGISLPILKEAFSLQVYKSFLQDRSSRLRKKITQLVDSEPIADEDQ